MRSQASLSAEISRKIIVNLNAKLQKNISKLGKTADVASTAAL